MIVLIQKQVRAPVRSIALFSLGVSLLVLIGWAGDIEFLKTVFPGFITMKVNTAIGLALTSVGLLALLRKPSLFREVFLSVSCSLVFLIGFLTLNEYLLDRNFGIDEFFVRVPMPSGSLFSAGRMAPITALNLILISLGMLLTWKDLKLRVAQFLIFVVFLISFQALTGYFLGISDSLGFARYTQMALHSACLFLLLSIGILLVRPDAGIMGVLGSRLSVGGVARRLILAAMLVPPVVGWMQAEGQKHHLYSDDFGILIRVMGNTIFLSIIIWRICIRLKTFEEARVEAQSQLETTNAELEHIVSVRTQAYQESEAQVRAILNSALDAIIGMDSGGVIQEWNPRAESMFGWKREEAIGQRMSDLIMPERFRKGHERGMAQFLTTKKEMIFNQSLETTALRKDQTEFPIELSISAIPLQKSFIFTAFISDISKRKSDEKRLIQLNAELESKVKEAKQASELKSYFLANMSHEIRTPINGVIGMTALMLDSELSDQQREYLEITRASANSLLYIVNDILDLSKIEAGKLELEKIDFEVTSMLGDLHRSMQHAAQTKGLRMQFDLPQSLTVNVVGDPGRLRQVFLNLLSNAIKFTEKGSVQVTGRVTDESSDKIEFYFEVRDTGIGISRQALPKLFQPFSQADNSTTRKFGGTGLGLSICQHMVEMMGGKIGVRSSLHEGTTFWFTVQLQKSKNPMILSSKHESSEKPQLVGQILVVEDNPVNQKVARAVLEKLGHRVTVASNGVEALEFLNETSFDLIFMDCQMPEMDGFEATARIRNVGTAVNSQQIPIVAMTANAISGDREKCLSAGMNDYISKPVQVEKLEKVVMKWLRKVEIQSA